MIEKIDGLIVLFETTNNIYMVNELKILKTEIEIEIANVKLELYSEALKKINEI